MKNCVKNNLRTFRHAKASQNMNDLFYNSFLIAKLGFLSSISCIHDYISTIVVFLCHQCKCWPGFHLKDDGKTCVDVDECSATLPCSQRCINTYGSYKCLCVDGYEALERNPNTCKALSGQPDFSSLRLQNFSV